MVQFRTVPTIYIKNTAKGDANITIDMRELKKVPEWVKEKKDGQELRQFFIRRGDNPSIYEVYDDNEDMPEGEKKEWKKKDDDSEPVPF